MSGSLRDRAGLILAVPVAALCAVLCVATAGTAAARQPRKPAKPRLAVFHPVTWRMGPEVDRILARPGQRITYTMTLRRVQDPAKVAAWLCALGPAKAVCQQQNQQGLQHPSVVDDLNMVMQHATYNHDARGAKGTSITVLPDGDSTIITARPAGPRVPMLRFTFSVTVRRGTRPGTAIRNMALVMFAVANIRPGSIPLSNCPLDVPLFAVPNGDGNLEEMAPAAAIEQATAKARLASCLATTIVPPNPGPVMTGFGGMAGHVGNLGRPRHASRSR
jgi:hypothetical protein